MQGNAPHRLTDSRTGARPGAPKSVVIVGGGTAGWMTAAALSRLLAPAGIAFTLVESEAIGTVGVGEATLPHLRFFNERLGIAESDFLRATMATIKLGIQFCDWGRKGDAYIHPFGDYGRQTSHAPFHHLWTRARLAGKAGRICDYSLPVIMAERGRFAPPAKDPESIMSTFSYAYQMDASLYAAFMRRLAETRGVARIEGRITHVAQDPQTGDVQHLTLDNGATVAGDLFIDCSGFRSLLLGQTLNVPYESWASLLPCDRAVAVPCESNGPPLPYTRATARSAGWQWRIPLQHRIGNGYVYSSAQISDDNAAAELLRGLDGAPTGEPRLLKFEAGRRRLQWSRNVVAIGLSSGFLEPLESTSIYLIQAAITALVELFPTQADDRADRDEFNRVMMLEYDRIRDFLVLHYHATERDDTPFWNYVRTMCIPDSLQDKLDLFRSTGTVTLYKDGLFLEPSWLAVYLGQRVEPKSYALAANAVSEEKLQTFLQQIRIAVAGTVERLPAHADYLRGAARAAVPA